MQDIVRPPIPLNHFESTTDGTRRINDARRPRSGFVRKLSNVQMHSASYPSHTQVTKSMSYRYLLEDEGSISLRSTKIMAGLPWNDSKESPIEVLSNPILQFWKRSRDYCPPKDNFEIFFLTW